MAAGAQRTVCCGVSSLLYALCVLCCPGAYAGLDRFAARDKLWGDMEAAGLVIKKEQYTTR